MIAKKKNERKNKMQQDVKTEYENNAKFLTAVQNKVSDNVQITNLLMGKIYGYDTDTHTHARMHVQFVTEPNESYLIDLIVFALRIWIDD